jgi:hypothetical protein
MSLGKPMNIEIKSSTRARKCGIVGAPKVRAGTALVAGSASAPLV